MLKSTIPHYPNPIDSRCVQFELSYFMLNKKQTDSLMLLFYNWCHSFMNNQCIDEWYWGQRKTASSSIPLRLAQTNAYTFGLDANVISDIVYDKKSYTVNKKKLLSEISISQRDLDCSRDYYEFYDSQFLEVPETPSAWKSALLSFFDEKSRVCSSCITATDIHAFASACPYYSKPNLFYGNVRFSVFLYCISDDISSVTANMVAFLREASVSLGNINACISLSPILSPSPCSPHMTYFGGNVLQDGTHIAAGVMPNEWYKFYYLQGAEWFNIVSPLVQRHVTTLSSDVLKYSNIAYETLDSGAVAIWVTKEITNVDVDDLIPMKRILYHALYPGVMSVEKQFIISPEVIGLIAKPRRRWELIPIFDDEIIVTDKHIVFQHCSKQS